MSNTFDHNYYTGSPMVDTQKILDVAAEHAARGETVMVHDHPHGHGCNVDCRVFTPENPENTAK